MDLPDVRIVELEKVRHALAEHVRDHGCLASLDVAVDLDRLRGERVVRYVLDVLGRRDPSEQVTARRRFPATWLDGLLRAAGNGLSAVADRAPEWLLAIVPTGRLIVACLDRVRWEEVATATTVYRLCPHLDSSGPGHRRCVAWLADPLWESRESHRAEMRLRHALRGMLEVYDPRSPYRHGQDIPSPQAALDQARAALGWGEP